MSDELRSARNTGQSGLGRPRLRVLRLGDVVAEPIQWLWQDRLARGKLHQLVGDPGLGKSMVTLDIAARITTAKPWPDAGVAPLGDVVVLSAEDGPADTIRPRVETMGGDTSRVWVLAADESLSLDKDLERLRSLIADKQPVLVVIDPITAYLGNVDWRNDPDVRRVLSPLASLAAYAKAAILGVMHLNKDEQRRAIYRTGGSVAFVAGARVVLAVVADPADRSGERRILVSAKSNIGLKPPGLAYHVEADGPIPHIAWDGEMEVDVEEIFRREGQAARPAPRTDEAKAMLGEFLGTGPRPVVEIRDEAKKRSIAWPTVERAKRELGISALVRSGGGWLWSLPATTPLPPDDDGTHHHHHVGEQGPLTGSDPDDVLDAPIPAHA